LTYLWIGIGSAIGGCARYGLGTAVAAWSGPGFPWGTLAVNVLGCFLIGVFAPAFAALPWRQFLMIGFCGGFTTFSSFGLETLNLLRDGQPARAAAYVAASVAICLFAVWAGHAVSS
jgi:fluoride exporter